MSSESSNVEILSPGDIGRVQLAKYGYAQVLKIGNRVEISGQGGWHPKTVDFSENITLEEEYDQAFDNVAIMLASVGASWKHVVHINSYHIPSPETGQITDGVELMVQRIRERTPDRAPIWTCVGVPALGNPDMRVEIRVTAIIE